MSGFMSLTQRVSLSDLENNTMKQQCAAMTQCEFLLVLIFAPDSFVCI